MKQITLNFDASEFDAYEWCHEYVQARTHQQFKDGRKVLQKEIASDMDMGQSQLSKKLAHADGAVFSLKDFQVWLRVTRDPKPVYYLLDLLADNDDEEMLRKQIADLEARLKKGKRK